MEFLIDLPRYALSFVAILTVLVFVHELGHFWIARRCGVRVEVFSIGFGPELFGRTDRAGTRWKFSALPLGGYVKMFGHPATVTEADGGERPMTAEERRVAFLCKSLAQRTAIVLGGPLANFLFAVVVLAGLFSLYGQQFSSNEVGSVLEGSHAEAGRKEAGVRLLSLNGQPIERFEEIAAIVQLGLDEPLDIMVERDGRPLALVASPQIIVQTDNFGNIHRIGRLGIGSTGGGEVVQYDPLSAVWAATVETYRLTAATLKAVGQMVVGTRPAEELGGILRIAKMSGDVTQTGLVAAISFAALLSINLGLINLFPIPMLDGGHLAFYAIEAVRGRPLGERAMDWGFRIGFVLVIALFVFATRNDLMLIPGVVDFIKRLIT